jgi:hypothetical protein
MKTKIFYDITSCSPLRINQRFRGTHSFLLRDRIIELLVYASSGRYVGIDDNIFLMMQTQEVFEELDFCSELMGLIISLCSVVGTETGYGLDYRGVGVRGPAVKNFHFSTFQPASNTIGNWGSFPEGKIVGA